MTYFKILENRANLAIGAGPGIEGRQALHCTVGQESSDARTGLTPNLQALSLRRMPQITNKVFADMFEFFGHLRTVDLCDCEGL